MRQRLAKAPPRMRALLLAIVQRILTGCDATRKDALLAFSKAYDGLLRDARKPGSDPLGSSTLAALHDLRCTVCTERYDLGGSGGDRGRRDAPRVPVQACSVESHVLCRSCAASLATCPFCRGPVQHPLVEVSVTATRVDELRTVLERVCFPEGLGDVRLLPAGAAPVAGGGFCDLFCVPREGAAPPGRGGGTIYAVKVPPISQ